MSMYLQGKTVDVMCMLVVKNIFLYQKNSKRDKYEQITQSQSSLIKIYTDCQFSCVFKMHYVLKN